MQEGDIMRRLVRRLAVPAVSLLAGAVGVAVHLGCGASAPPAAAEVGGRLTFQGKPVAGGVVVFAPDPARGATGPPVRADTRADGTFDLPADGTVRPGWYRVALAPPADEVGRGFPPQLARPDRSGLVRQVTAGGRHLFEFAVEVPEG